MGIKSRNSKHGKIDRNKKRGGLFAAVLLIISAEAAFLFQYPSFKDRAAGEEPDILSSSDFLHEIYQANTVLYRQIREIAEGKELSYRDLYLTAEEQQMENASEYYDFGKDTPLSFAGGELESLLADWDNSLQEMLDSGIDYEIVDSNSQKTYANIGRPLTTLGNESVDVSLEERYPYYIKMQFDENGLLSHVWARGEDVDSLLKSIQRVMRSRYLERSLYERLSYSAFGRIDWEEPILYGQDNDVRQMQLHISNTPKNCVICYAITDAQMAQIRESSRLFSAAQEGNYYNSGIQQYFSIILAVFGLAVLLLPLWRGYHLHERFLLPLHIESIAVLLFTAFLVLRELAAGMVQCTMTDQWAYSLSYAIRSVLPGLSLNMADALVLAANLLFLTMSFTLWFVLVSALCQAYLFGFRNYLRKRWLGLRIYRSLRISVRRGKSRFVREAEHLDLERDMNLPLLKLVAANYLLLAFLCLFWVFGLFLLVIYSVLLYVSLKKYIRFMQEKYACMVHAVWSVADGNLQTAFTGDWGMFESFKEALSDIQDEFSEAVEEEVKSQRMRTELITNVSHDLKTPLTAMITYIDLLQEEGVTQEQREEYLEVLERKSLRLKGLIEDLFEVSKASSGSVTFRKEKVDICNLVRQVYLEYEDKANAANLTFRFALPDKKLFLMLDGEKTSRIFDNLYINIIKYAMPDTRVYVTVEEQNGEVQIELKNISGTELNVPPERLTDRFVRGDSARSGEGSGLGLAIARSFVELQEGRMHIKVDGDLFKVILIWKEDDGI